MNTSAKGAKANSAKANSSTLGTEILPFSQELAARQNRIVELKQRIEQGTFCPTNEEVAQAILRDVTSRPMSYAVSGVALRAYYYGCLLRFLRIDSTGTTLLHVGQPERNCDGPLGTIRRTALRTHEGPQF